MTTTLKEMRERFEQAPRLSTANAYIVKLERENEALREALKMIADEETGWPYKVDPLEHAHAVIEDMRDVARRALTESEANHD